MVDKAGLLESSRRRSRKSTLAVRLLWIIALVCIFVWFRGFCIAVAADASGLNEYGAGIANLTSKSFGQYLRSNGIDGVSHGLLQVEWMWVTGSPRAHNLRTWASSSFPLALVGEGAFLFSIYLRKKGC